MIINSVFSNRSTFKNVDFSLGMNVVLAEQAETSGSRDTRNGLGKSTLIRIIHFCLGANTRKGRGLVVSDLRGWKFCLNLTVDNREIIATRSVDDPSRIFVDGDIHDLPISPREENGHNFFRVEEWRNLLGFWNFGLSVDQENKYAPSFRNLISYFIRHPGSKTGSFSSPFENFSKQPAWSKQVCNAFLLGLSWENASELQKLKDEENLLVTLKKLQDPKRNGIVTQIIGSRGELEAARVRLEQQRQEREAFLSDFRVHPQYNQIQEDADRLTSEIHQLVNERLKNSRITTFYRKSLENEDEPSSEDVARLYRSAGIQLPDMVSRRLDEVENFHRQIVANRREFLSCEIERISERIINLENEVNAKIEQRASLLRILDTHGALEEYTRLQELHLDIIASLNQVNQRIEEIRTIEEGKSALRIEKERLMVRARRDYEERHIQASRAINQFSYNSRFLYDAQGDLIINVGPNGYQFDVTIDRSGSEGIEKMKIFCYDLMLAQILSQRNSSPNLLVHDSTIFDGVDERQVALALELASTESSRLGCQYICTLNSDTVPYSSFSSEFIFDNFIKLRLTDDEGGNLLGIDFEGGP